MKKKLYSKEESVQKQYGKSKFRIQKAINPSFDALSDFVASLPDSKSLPGKTIYSGRNDVSVVEIDGIRLSIKSYNRLTDVNRLLYGTLRKSKAQRAYEHAFALTNRGIETPMPVAFIDCFKHRILQKSYFICLYVNYPPLSDFIARPIAESEALFRALGRFTYRLHLCGVYHNDYNMGNILVMNSAPDYDFCLIDNNRMHFGKYSRRKSMKSMRRMILPADRYAIVGAAYAEASQTSDIGTVSKMLFYRDALALFYRFKQKVKKLRHLLGFKSRHHSTPESSTGSL
ncbi:lipopolysaccharide kinase InaA family protein [Limibacterium fermenti]|uniref:lipopolysaccharide kinase InaA family protein n=1 Tax=Limibacterium fermenti TaxID=3229863 RepID=UPI000E825F8C|nr:hypothetical protein [Porphyromonadaceae bacterium]HBX45070.1 hypothetical protein [Porphyromonadaceae bacterium]